MSTLSSKKRTKTSRQVVKSNLFIRFLEEISAWKNNFEFFWPLEINIWIKSMVAGMIKVVCGTITGVVSLINIVTMLYALMHSNSLQDGKWKYLISTYCGKDIYYLV